MEDEVRQILFDGAGISSAMGKFGGGNSESGANSAVVRSRPAPFLWPASGNFKPAPGVADVFLGLILGLALVGMGELFLSYICIAFLPMPWSLLQIHLRLLLQSTYLSSSRMYSTSFTPATRNSLTLVCTKKRFLI